MLKKFFSEKKGSFSLELIWILLIFLPIFFGSIVGMNLYFTSSYKNSNLNFEIGRYVQVTGCDVNKLSSTLPNLRQFNTYNIVVNDTTVNTGTAGNIDISCPVPTAKGSEFTVASSIRTNATLFPKNHTMVGYYVQEAK